jgi:hypothetical protein
VNVGSSPERVAMVKAFLTVAFLMHDTPANTRNRSEWDTPPLSPCSKPVATITTLVDVGFSISDKREHGNR